MFIESSKFLILKGLFISMFFYSTFDVNSFKESFLHNWGINNSFTFLLCERTVAIFVSRHLINQNRFLKQRHNFKFFLFDGNNISNIHHLIHYRQLEFYNFDWFWYRLKSKYVKRSFKWIKVKRFVIFHVITSRISSSHASVVISYQSFMSGYYRQL